MHLASLDYMAYSGNSILHKLQPIVKIIISFIMICTIIILTNTLKLTFMLIFAAVLILVSRINIREVVHLVIYPLFFSLLFALFRFQESYYAGTNIILKSVGIALTMIMLVSTTSYIDIFSFFSLFMPSLLVDIFVFTYRSLFILIDKLESAIRNIRLRGGFHPLYMITNFRSVAGIIGITIIHSIDMSDRMYKIYSLRGYNGKIPMVNAIRIGKKDFIVLTISLLIISIIFFIP